ncbi:MAG TPA: NAD(P)/FAD-dependent oxidoreductase [Dehalococcoidia bacterium]|nr:NAD(P)/FAD-dependent oxidoreductase [Dehalococcoidia bacterium]
MSLERRRVAVIGGGVAGLTAAYRLLQRGHQVHVYEAGPEWGGLVRTFQVGGGRLECFYHHIFTTDTTIVALLGELGLSPRLVWRDSKVGIYYQGRLYPFVTPIDLLRFTPVGLTDRIRLGLMGLYLRRQRDGDRFMRVTAREWVSRFAGRRNWDVVWGPLFRGKFGDMADQVSMVWLWNKVRLRFSSRRGGPLQKEVLGYLLGSFGLMVDELVARIRALGGHLHAATPVQGVTVEDGRATGVVLADGTPVPADAVVATVANRIFLRLVPQLPQDYVALCQGIPYQDALCMVLALRRPLTRFYWLNINDRGFPFLALIEHTNFIGPENYGGQHVLYISNYLEKGHPYFEMSEGELWDVYRPYLARINPQFDDSWVTGRWLFKGPDAQPVFTVENAGRVPPQRTPIGGLYLANMSQIFPEDRGQNYSIRLGEQVADLVAQDLARASSYVI